MVQSNKPKLYVLVGYPGAGKTRVARSISQATGAVHLWADTERHQLFPNPTHSLEESQKLYDKMNHEAEELLAQGKDVVFDTNFNFYEDRQKMRDIAARQNAEAVVVWVTTPLEVAKKRAVGTRMMRNGYTMSMTQEQFDAIAAKLEPPQEHENLIKIDCTSIDDARIVDIFK